MGDEPIVCKFQGCLAICTGDKMETVHETIILEADNVRITNLRAFIGWKTYEISRIVSVRLEQQDLNPAAGKIKVIISFISLIFGMLLCSGAMSIRLVSMIENYWYWPRINVYFMFAVLGLLFVYLWSITWEADKPTYIVQIETTSGISKPLKVKEKVKAEKIISAINYAIAYRADQKLDSEIVE
jgi:hypothetical protein